MRWQFASTFAVMAMSGCFKESTVPCPNGVLCPADQACTGNEPSDDPNVKLCALEGDIVDCETRAERENCNGTNGAGLCVHKLCVPCWAELFECRYAEWTQVPSSASHLAAIWMEAENRGYAVGNGGIVLVYDGVSWNRRPDIVPPPGYVGVWGSGGVVYALSNDGVVYRDGIAMPNSVSEPPPTLVTAIWGRAADDLVALGADGGYGEFKGVEWRWGSVGGVESLQGVFGAGDAIIAVGKARIAHRPSRDAAWVTIPPPNITDALLDVWGTSASDFYVVGNGANVSLGVLHHYKDGNWSTPPVPAMLPRLEAIWGNAADDIYAVGLSGTFLHYDGMSWQLMRPTSTSAPQISDVAGSGNAAVAVGADGTIWRINPF